MSELSPNTTCHLCQGDVGNGGIVSIGEKGANRINKACVERGDDTHLTAGTGVQSYMNKKLIYKHNKTKCVATPSRKRSVRISREPYDSTKDFIFVGTKLRRAKSVLTTITIVVLEHLLAAKLDQQSPFSDEVTLRNIITGINADTNVSVQNIFIVGTDAVTNMEGQAVFSYSHKRTNGECSEDTSINKSHHSR